MTSFLHDAKARIQHTNKLSLAPKDLKNLADIISTEKNVVSTSSKLSVDYRKAAEALREWGVNEGDDLADILPKLSILLGHLADAQARFSDHDGTYRIHFKSIRMREESLSALKKSKETIQAKIVGFEKKITKMSSENKDLPALTSRLQESRSELVSLENSVAIEEARLSDFKRETVREGLSLRLGAMLELAEKMTIVCEFGRMLTSAVPIERTSPGSTRAPYYAASKTQAVVEEAQQCLTQVVFNPAPSPTRANLETSPEHQSTQSPDSDREHPITPRPNAQTPQTFSTELPPLYFDGGIIENPVKPPSGADSPHYMHNTSTSEAHPSSNYRSSQSYTHERTQNSGYPDPSSSSHSPNTSDVPTGPLPDLPNGSLGLETGTSSYVDNSFYVLGRDGVPQSTGPGNQAEYIQPHASSASRPISTVQSEIPKPVVGHSSDYHTGPREHSFGMNPTDMTAHPPSGETASVTSERLPISPRHHELPLSSRSSGTLTTEARTTNAGAFRRALGSNIRPPGSNQSIINTDEALNTAAVSSIHPLHINKQDSRSVQQ